jgi:uncharacterized protein (DUF1015 family)
MIDLASFCAWRYHPERVPDLQAVTAPPYDVIDPAYQKVLHDRHPWNIVHLELGEEFPGDGNGHDRYSRAAQYLAQWQAQGVLRQDPEPGMYLVQQRFQGFNGLRLTRRGFIALLRLEPLGGGAVFPHEETFPKHKIDRLNLLRACRAQFNPIFSVFPDPAGDVTPLLEPPDTPPDGIVVDDLDVEHRMWVMRDPKWIRSVSEAMRSKIVYLADGHHRYETSLKYRDERRTSGGSSGLDQASQWTLMYFAPMEEKGLVIHPTHKMVRGIQGFDPDGFLAGLGSHFTVARFSLDPAGQRSLATRLLLALREQGGSQCAIGLVMGQTPNCWILTPRDRASLSASLPGVPECIRDLDVTVLHETILRERLRIDVADPGESHLLFSHEAEEAIGRVARGEAQAAFIMNPIPIHALRDVAAAGCKMPQKATYFYPKMLSGLVIYHMGRGKG